VSGSEKLSPLRPRLPRRAETPLVWAHLHGSSRGLALVRAAEREARPLVVVVPDTPTASRLIEELDFFASDEAATPIAAFPDWETLPYDTFSPHHDIVSERLAALYGLPGLARGILVVPITTAMVRMPPRDYLLGSTLILSRGERLDLDAMRLRLTAAGYRSVGQAMEHGEFAVRGALLDLFPMGSPLPYRIDLFDEEVESIRTFDPETQRTVGRVDTVRLIPAREFPTDEAGIARFRQRWRARFEGDPTGCPLYRDVSQGLFPSGIEYYLPLFFERTETLFDYVPEHAVMVAWEGIGDAARAFQDQVRERYESRRHDVERPLLAPGEMFLGADDVQSALEGFARVHFGRFDGERLDGAGPGERCDYATRPPLGLPVNPRAAEPLAVLERFLGEFAGRVLFVAESAGRREALLEIFHRHGLRPRGFPGWQAFLDTDTPLGLTVATLESGAVLEAPRVAVISETQLFGERARARRQRSSRRDPESVIRELTELSPGSPVVHEHHGVGRYRGLETLTFGGLTSEFLIVEYAGGDRLYVPVASLHLVTRYTGAEPDQAPLHRLGSAQWQKARRKAAERAVDVAAELLEIYARRAARGGRPFDVDERTYRAFAEGFPFEETPDQQAAIDDVLANMRAEEPMDRLVCGDVGFGKTEVAMRAAFVAVENGSQVGVLVPTTLLAQQHYQTFTDRFADWPVRIELLSRFRTRKQQDKVLADLAAGRVDIVIGTHKLLQKDVRFKRLGLVIIDEEHRFGVRQKERLKQLRAEADVLTLTATPIPRTLNMALSGLRDLSLISTPPERRLSIQTFVREWDDALVREAILREIRRGGQVFFVHNRVETIERTAERVQALVPEASVRVAHGQMQEHALERAMLDFYHRRFNVLVCTTIIETGLDVPTANTIIINRADRFGLAQLHQLRGRVGRSHHRAYAFLVVPPHAAMTADAVKRLEAIESLEDLGIGFLLATHDLEIRGAGELLGEEQSGQIHEVGYSLYTELLERAVQALKAGRSPELDRPLDHGTEIDLQVPALIPEDYLPDVHTRLILYKRIASAPSVEALDELKVEMIDRFGLLPEPTKTLFRITELKLKASPLGIRKIELGARGGRILFDDQPDVDPGAVIQLVQGDPRAFRFEGPRKLRLNLELDDGGARIDTLERLLERLGTRIAA